MKTRNVVLKRGVAKRQGQMVYEKEIETNLLRIAWVSFVAGFRQKMRELSLYLEQAKGKKRC